MVLLGLLSFGDKSLPYLDRHDEKTSTLACVLWMYEPSRLILISVTAAMILVYLSDRHNGDDDDKGEYNGASSGSSGMTTEVM